MGWNTSGNVMLARMASLTCPLANTVLCFFSTLDATHLNGTKSLLKSPPHWAVKGANSSMKAKFMGSGLIRAEGSRDVSPDWSPPRFILRMVGVAGGSMK